MKPKRIQRKRTKGWRMPEGAVYVGRPTVWGNPYIITADCQHQSWFEADLKREMASRAQPSEDHPWAMHFWRMARRLHELRGKDLACWCGPEETRCHADVLLRLANAIDTAKQSKEDR